MSEVIGDAAKGVGVAGKAPELTLILDRNGNGIPDYEEPAEIVKLITDVFGYIGAAVPGASMVGQLASFVLTKALPVISAGVNAVENKP